MCKKLTLFIVLALSLALGTTGLSMSPILSALAEGAVAEVQTGETSTREPVSPEVEPTQPPAQKDDAADATPSDVPTETYEAGSAPDPVQETAEEAATAEPALFPSEEPDDAPTAMPTQAPSETTDAPAQSPLPMPSETPAAPGDVIAGVYQVSPAEAVYITGSRTSLTFDISPSGAPFLGVEGVECAYADGVVTIGAEALDALGGGEHILAFLFEGGSRVEVPLKVIAAKAAVAKGLMDTLKIGGMRLGYEQLKEDQSNPDQHWAWNAATATLTLDGYHGGNIYATGERALTVLAAAGSVNTISSSDVDALYAYYGLILKGGGTLSVSSDNSSAVVSTGTITIESGTFRASGKENAFYSVTNDIRVSGGKVEAKQTGHRGGGFSSRNLTRVSGGSVTVEGALTAFSSLAVSGGTVTINNCEAGVSGGLTATGGNITIEDVSGSAAVSAEAMRFTGCTLNIRDCGEYGLNAAGGLTVGQGGNLKIEAGKFALYAPGKTGTIRIEKGANLDLSGGEGALKGGKVLVGGKAYTGAYNHLVIQNGLIVRKENAMQSLIVGGQSYGAFSLSSDLVGEGWGRVKQDADAERIRRRGGRRGWKLDHPVARR